MVTALLYLALIVLVGLLLFVVASLVFGRGERMAPPTRPSSPAWLPEHTVDGDDIRALRFTQALRGYKTAEVDAVLRRLSGEVDRLRAELAARDASVPRVGPVAPVEQELQSRHGNEGRFGGSGTDGGQ